MAARLALTTVVTAAIFGLLIVTMRFKLIKTNFDIYGFWDLAVSNFIVGLLVWEAYHYIGKFIAKRKAI